MLAELCSLSRPEGLLVCVKIVEVPLHLLLGSSPEHLWPCLCRPPGPRPAAGNWVLGNNRLRRVLLMHTVGAWFSLM